MEQMKEWQSARLHASRTEFIERLAHIVHHDGSVEALPGLILHRASAPTGLAHGVSFPSFCLIAQGSKEVFLGDKRYRFDPAHYLIASVSLPYATSVTEADRVALLVAVHDLVSGASIGDLGRKGV